MSFYRPIGEEKKENMKVSKQIIQVKTWSIHYEVIGEGEPLVLVHGLAESTRVWNRNLSAFAERYRVYLIDLPGFGAMRNYHQQLHLTELDVWLDEWMRAIGLERINLVGHSMGAYVCMALAAMQPERIKHLVLVDSIGLPFHLPIRCLVYPALKAIVRTGLSFCWRIGYDYLRAGPKMVLRAARQVVALDATSVISSVHVPTLLVWGENDDLIPSSYGRQLHERLPNAHFLLLSGANHFCMYEQPSVFNQVVCAFLQGEEIGRDTVINTSIVS